MASRRLFSDRRSLSSTSSPPLGDALLYRHIATDSKVPALLGRVTSAVRYQSTAATYLGGLRTPYQRSISSAQAINVPSVRQTLATRIKVVNFLSPYQRRGNFGLFGGAAVGKNYAYYSAQPGGGGSAGSVPKRYTCSLDSAHLCTYICSCLGVFACLYGFMCRFKKGWRKGRMHGLSCRGNRVSFGKYGFQALEPAWITARQLEAGRRAMSRNARAGGKIWVRVITDKPVTAKPTEVRMGKGKGAVSHRVAVVLPGRILYEVSGVAENVARRAITIAGSKMPIKTKFVVAG